MIREQARVLVVDDEARYRQVAKVNLELRGYQVLTAQDGQAALSLVVSQEPDLVLLDVRMPGLDGYQVCQRIREFSSVPIIMLTALAEDRDKVEVLLDRKDAIRHGIESSKATDTVIIAGKGHERIQAFHRQEIPFDDREIAREVLQDVAQRDE